MTETVEVVVIGGGVIGLAIARSLTRRIVGRIAVVDRSEPGKEASFAAAGMLAPQAEANAADNFFELCCRSRDLYPSLAAELFAETGIDIELDQTGTLYCAFSEDDEEEIARRYAWQRRAELAVERLDAAQARELEPNIAASVRSALRFPLDVQVENRRLLQALIATNKLSGVKLITNTSVTAVKMEGNRVAGVETSSGSISSPHVVVASGAWTSSINTGAAASQIHIEPVRGQIICFAPDSEMPRHVVYSPRGYLVPRQDGRLLAGSTSEAVGFDKLVTENGISLIRAHANEISPALAALPVVDSWAGLRPRAEDCLPVLGKVADVEGLFYATGHYRNGILLAPLTGELIAGLIADNVVTSELEPFTPNRFESVGVN